MAAYRALAVLALAALPLVPAAPQGAGAGIGVWPVCSATPMRPGRSHPVSPLGLGGGVTVTNPGSGTEALSLQVIPVLSGTALHGYGLAVPPSWVIFTYPRLWWVIGQHSVKVGAGGAAQVPVRVSVPAGARRGTYTAMLTAGTAAQPAPGAISMGAAAATYLIFTVGVARPPWPPHLTAKAGCWGTRPGPASAPGTLGQPAAATARGGPAGHQARSAPWKPAAAAAAAAAAIACWWRYRRRR